MATFVLVHGAWHGAGCREPVTKLLTDRGVPALALALPGHGDDPRSLTDLHGHGDAVRAALARRGGALPLNPGSAGRRLNFS